MFKPAVPLFLVAALVLAAFPAAQVADGPGLSACSDADASSHDQLAVEEAPSIQEGVDTESGGDDLHGGHGDLPESLCLSLIDRHRISIGSQNDGRSRVPASIRGRSPPA